MNTILPVTESTKVQDILKAYPWLPDALIGLDARFKALHSPLTKALLGKATVGDVCKRFNVSADFLVEQLEQLVEQHNG